MKTKLALRGPFARYARATILAQPAVLRKLRRPTTLRPTIRRPSTLGK